MSRVALALLALVVAGALLSLATDAAQVRLAVLAAPSRALKVPGWVDLGEAPPTDAAEYVCAGRASDYWTVEVADGVLRARPAEYRSRDVEWPYELDFAHALDPSPEPRTATYVRWATGYAREHARRWVEPVIDGWLVGFDAGEYGGSLWWYPARPGRGVKLAGGNVRSVRVSQAREGAVVFIGGLMEQDEGRVLLVWRAGSGSWAIRDTRALRGWPMVVLEQPEGSLVATTRSVETVSVDGVPLVLSDVSPLRMDPVSLVVAPRGEIVVGMQHLIVVLRPSPSGYAARWYAPVPCAVLLDDQ